MTFAKYPIGGSGSGGVQTVANAAARALLIPDDGDLVLQLDTDELYEWNGVSWAVIADRTYNDPIVNADISATAAIARSKLASGTASHVLINDGTGVMSSEATLAKSRGGTGADNTSVTFPGSGTIVTETGSQTLTNKTIDADFNAVSNIDNADIKTGAAIARAKLASGTASHVVINDGTGAFSSEATLAKSRGGTGADNSSVTFPASGTLVTETGTQTLTNKTLTSPVINTPTGITKSDVGLGNVDNTSDATKNAAAVSLTNKTIDADLNTITNIENADIKVGAAILRNKLASGTASHVLINDGSGVMSSEAQLATSRGGTGVNSTATFPSSGVVVTEAGSQTLTNKKVSSTAAMTGALELPSGTTADRSGLTTTGMVRHNTSINEFEGYSNGAWQPIGSGLNEQPVKNYLKTYANAAVPPGTLSTLASTTSNLVSLTAFYADSTSGSSALSQSSDTSLRGSFNYLTATGTSSSTGARFVQFPAFALEGSDVGKPISLSFDVTGVTADGNWDVVVVRYNSSGTHQSIISVAGNASGATPPSAKLPTGTTVFNGFFVPDSTTAGDLYAVRLRSLANTVQIRVDNLFCGQQPIRAGGSSSDPQSYTPTLKATITDPTATCNGKWRRNCSHMEVEVFANVTALGSGFYYFTLPTGYTIDHTQMSANLTDRGIGKGNGYIVTNSGATRIEVVPGFSTGSPLTNGVIMLPYNSTAITHASLTTNAEIWLAFSVPITGWSSNVTMADRAVEEYASNSGTATAADDTTSFAYGIQGSLIPAFTAAAKRYVRFTTPIQPTDTLITELDLDGTGRWQPIGSRQFSTSRNVDLLFALNTVSYGVSQPYAVNSTDAEVFFGTYRSSRDATTYGGVGSAWSTITGSARWRVRKVSGGAQVGYPIASSNIILQDTISVLTGATTLAANATNVRYICNSGSAFTVTLPAAASVSDGTIFRFKNIGAGIVTLDGNASETIDGALTLAMSQYVSIDIMEYNGAWFVL